MNVYLISRSSKNARTRLHHIKILAFVSFFFFIVSLARLHYIASIYVQLFLFSVAMCSTVASCTIREIISFVIEFV